MTSNLPFTPAEQTRRLDFLKALIYRYDNVHGNHAFYQMTRERLHVDKETNVPCLTLPTIPITMHAWTCYSPTEMYHSAQRREDEFKKFASKKKIPALVPTKVTGKRKKRDDGRNASDGDGSMLLPEDKVDICITYVNRAWRDYKAACTLESPFGKRVGVAILKNETVNDKYVVKFSKKNFDNSSLHSMEWQIAPRLSKYIRQYDWLHILWFKKSNAPAHVFLPSPPHLDNLNDKYLLQWACATHCIDLLVTLFDVEEANTKQQVEERTPGTVANAAKMLDIANMLLFPRSCAMTSYMKAARENQSRVEVIRLFMGHKQDEYPSWPFILPTQHWPLVLQDMILNIDTEAIQYILAHFPPQAFDPSQVDEVIQTAFFGKKYFSNKIMAIFFCDGDTTYEDYINKTLPRLVEFYADVLREHVATKTWIAHMVKRILKRDYCFIAYSEAKKVSLLYQYIGDEVVNAAIRFANSKQMKQITPRILAIRNSVASPTDHSSEALRHLLQSSDLSPEEEAKDNDL